MKGDRNPAAFVCNQIPPGNSKQRSASGLVSTAILYRSPPSKQGKIVAARRKRATLRNRIGSVNSEYIGGDAYVRTYVLSHS